MGNTTESPQLEIIELNHALEESERQRQILIETIEDLNLVMQNSPGTELERLRIFYEDINNILY